MVQLQSSSPPEVRIGVSPEAAAGLRQSSEYSLAINDLVVPATLKTVVPRRDENTRTVDALFVLEHSSSGVRPGDLARLETKTWIDQPGFWVPLAALTEGPRGLWQSLVAQPGSESHYTLVTRTVEVLHADAQRAFVRGTLVSGDLLVSDGAHRVVAGQRVALTEPGRSDHVAIAAPEQTR